MIYGEYNPDNVHHTLYRIEIQQDIQVEIWEEISVNADNGAKRLVDEYGKRLYAAACVLCPDKAAAEDLVFRTLSRAIRKISQYRQRSPFFSWLYGIMLNFYRMDTRGRGAKTVYLDTLPESPEMIGDGVEEMMARADAQVLRDALRRLAPILKEVVLLRYFEDRSIAEIAEILQIPQGTVMSRLYNARGTLHRILSSLEKGEQK